MGNYTVSLIKHTLGIPYCAVYSLSLPPFSLQHNSAALGIFSEHHKFYSSYPFDQGELRVKVCPNHNVSRNL